MISRRLGNITSDGDAKGSYLGCTKVGSKADWGVSACWGGEPLPQRHLVLDSAV